MRQKAPRPHKRKRRLFPECAKRRLNEGYAKDASFQRRLASKSDFFFYLCALAHSVTQVVQFCSANLTLAGNFYLHNVGGMQREGLLGAYAERNASYGEGLGDTTVLLSDNGAFKKLNSLSGALNDTLMNLNGVTYVELRNLRLELLLCK